MNHFFTILLVVELFAGHSDREPLAQPECEVEFRIDNSGIEVYGRLLAKAEISFNENKLKESAITAKAFPTSISTGIAIRDKHLMRNDYFHVDLFPEITLTSKSFKKLSQSKFVGSFILTIKNFKKEITMPFSMVHKENATIYSGKFEINRLDFSLGEESLLLDEKVKIIVTARVQD